MVSNLNGPKPGDIRHKLLPFTETKATDASGADPDVAGEIEGLAAGILNIDKGEDLIFPGAFAAGMADFKANGFVAYQHDITSIIGRPLEVEERLAPDYGLWTKAEIVSTTLGADVMKLVRRKILKKLSIGYRLKEGGFSVLNRETLQATLRERAIAQTKVDEILQDFDRRKLETVFGLFDVDLKEYSVVTFPMNDRAEILGAKDEFNSALAALPFSLHPLVVLAANKGYVERARTLFKAYRAPEGRALNESHTEALKFIAEEGAKVSGEARALLSEIDALKSGGTGALSEEELVARGESLCAEIDARLSGALG